MVCTRRSLKSAEEVATSAVNDGQQQHFSSPTAPNYSPNHLNKGKTCSLHASKRWPSVYARRGSSSKKKTQHGDLADNSHLQLQNADAQLCDGVDYIQSSEAVIPAKEPKHEKEASNQAGMLQQCSFEQKQETVIPDPKGFDKFHSSGQLDLLIGSLNYNLPTAGNSSTSISAATHEKLDPLLDHSTMAGTGGAENADETTSRGGNNVASSNLNSVQGEISKNCFLGNGPQKSASFNLTEIAEKMANDGLDEVDSFGSETNLVSVGGYKVKPKYEFPLGHILSKYGDIGDDDLEEMMAYIEDLEKENLDIGWLKERVNDILEAKGAIKVLRSEKTDHAVLKAQVKKRSQQLEDSKREMAFKEVELQVLERKIFAAERGIVTMKDGVAKVKKVISENKDMVKRFLELDSLGEGLI